VEKKSSLRGERKYKWKRKDQSKWISKEESEVDRKMMVRKKKKPKTKDCKAQLKFYCCIDTCRHL
jgi:hypothetical protein